jgi:hypothetical protein
MVNDNSVRRRGIVSVLFPMYTFTTLYTDSRLSNKKKITNCELKDKEGSGLCTFQGTDIVRTWRDCVKQRNLSRILSSHSSGYEEIHLMGYTDV